MTGYTVHTGSSMKFSEGWDQIFRGAKSKRPAAGPESTGAKSNKKVAAKGTKVTAKRAVKKGATKKADSKKVKRGK